MDANNPWDGLWFGACVGLGFASVGLSTVFGLLVLWVFLRGLMG